jgi:hypothetical protein
MLAHTNPGSVGPIVTRLMTDNFHKNCFKEIWNMRTKFLATAVLFGLVSSGAIAMASPAVVPADSAALIEKLQEQLRADEHKEKSWSQEPIVRQDYQVQEAGDRQLIGEIQHGEPVSGEAIEQALKHINTPY